jgi:hypothetical protein
MTTWPCPQCPPRPSRIFNLGCVPRPDYSPRRGKVVTPGDPLDFYLTCSIGGAQKVVVTEGNAGFVCMSSPLIADQHPTEGHPVRRASFTITSKDQGWSDYCHEHGTYNRSHTWFRASARNENGELTEMRRQLFRNIYAGQEFKTHVITWNFDSEDEDERMWVRSLCRGQYIDLSVWAEYRGWVNYIDGDCHSEYFLEGN